MSLYVKRRKYIEASTLECNYVTLVTAAILIFLGKGVGGEQMQYYDCKRKLSDFSQFESEYFNKKS